MCVCTIIGGFRFCCKRFYFACDPWSNRISCGRSATLGSARLQPDAPESGPQQRAANLRTDSCLLLQAPCDSLLHEDLDPADQVRGIGEQAVEDAGIVEELGDGHVDEFVIGRGRGHLL